MTKATKPESVAEILKRRQANAKAPQQKTAKAEKPAKVAKVKSAKKPTTIKGEKKDIFKTFNSDFTGLRNTSEYIAFIDFMATPKELREIETQGEFSKHFKVSENTLTDWKRREGFWEDVREARRKYIREEFLGTALLALKKSILKDGKAPEVKLLYQLADEFEEKSSVEVKKPTKLTSEQMAGLAERLKRWKSENL